MNDADWRCAHTIARELARRGTDPNEAQKAFAYLRTHKDPERFFRFLNTLVTHGRILVRTGRTLDYNRTVLLKVCEQHLRPYARDPALMRKILGWAVRLLRFYVAQSAGTTPTREAPGQRQGRPRPDHRGRR